MIVRHFNSLSATKPGKRLIFLVLGWVLLMPVGAAPAQNAPERSIAGSENAENSKPALKLFSGLFNGLRSKPQEEAEKVAPKTTQKEAVSKSVAKPTSNPVTQPPAPAVPPTAPPSKIIISEKEGKSLTAPLPPESNYFEKIAQNSEEKGRVVDPFLAGANGGLGPDTLPPQAATTETLSTLQSIPEESPTAGLSSYSFDTRDWVEYYPVEHGVVEYAADEKTTDGEAVAEAAKETVTRSSSEPSSNELSSSEWNGEAMPIRTPPRSSQSESRHEPRQETTNSSLRLASIRQALPALSKDGDDKNRVNAVIDEKTADIDLTPSYLSFLKYSEVCGVVVVQADFPLTAIQPILDEIKLLQRDLNLYMGIPAPREKIELCLFRNESSYLAFLREKFPKAPQDRRALYIKLDGKPGTLLVQRTEEFEIDLRHEMTHAIIHASIRDVPIWLDEGLAKYFEVPIKDRATNNPYMKQIRWNTRFGAVPMLSRLEKLEHIGQMEAREYRDSWAWVHFMIHHSPQTHRLLAGYLQLLATLPEQAGSGGSARVPSLSLYLNDVLEFPRDSYREHFQGMDE